MKKVFSLALSVLMLLSLAAAAFARADGAAAAYAALRDPMKMSDEELLGVWDETTGEWTQTPRLRYGDFPGLSGVLGAVRSGDYGKAKSLLKRYYINRTQIPPYPVGQADTLSLSAQLYARNIIGNLSPVVCFDMTDEEKWYEIALPADGGALPSYQLLDSDRAGGCAEIASRESAHAPYMEVITAAGKTIRLGCTADTYLRAGQYKSVCYGKEEKILVSENEAPHGDGTRRAYLNFDISSVPDGDSVSEVRLYLYGRITGSSSMEIVLYNAPLLADMAESSVCWNDTTHGVFNYKNTLFDWSQPDGVEYEWINSLARLEKDIALTEYFRSGGGELYAYRVLEHIINLYTYREIDYPRPLDTSWRTPTLLTALFGLTDSEYMTDEVFCALLKNIAQTGEALKEAKKGVVNQNLAMKTAFLRLVLYLPEIFPESYNQIAKNNLLEAYNTKMMNEDGSYKEATSGYIGGVLDDMEEVIALLKKTEGSADERILEVYRRLALYYADLSMPDSRLVPYGDGGRINVRAHFAAAAEITGDRNLIFFANNFKKGAPPEKMSKVYPYKKLAVLRSGWTNKAMQLFTNAETGGQHGHPDDLHIDLYAFGYPLLTDPGNGGGYNGKLPAAYVRTETLPHNTVEINGKSQLLTSAGENKMELRGNSAFDFLEATTYANEGFEHTRKISFIKNSYIAVTDYITPEDLTAVNTYRQAWHPDNGGNVTVDSSSLAAKTHFAAGANLTVMQGEKTDVRAVTDKSYIKNKKLVNTLEDYVYYEKSTKGKGVYNTVLYPTDGSAPSDAAAEKLALSDGASEITASAFKIKADSYSGIYYISHEDEPSARTFGGFGFGGEMLYLTDNLSDICFLNASGVKKADGTVLVESKSRLADFSASADGTALNVSSSEAIDKELKIYAPNAETVLLNGSECDFIKIGNYVYINPEKIVLSPTDGSASVKEKIVFKFPVECDGLIRSGAVEIAAGTVVTGDSQWNGEIDISCGEKASRFYAKIGSGLRFAPGCTVKIPFYKGSSVLFNSSEKISARTEGNLCVFTAESGGTYELPVKWGGLNRTAEVLPSEDTYIINSSSGKNTICSGEPTVKITLPKATSSSGYRMGFMRFKYGGGIGENPADIQNADKIYLKLTVQSAPTNAGRLTAYGLEDGYWYNDTLFGAKSGWQADRLCAADMPSALKVYAENESSVSVTPDTTRYTELLFDVTDYAKSQADGSLAFKLYAQTDDGSALTASVYSSEGDFPPSLIIENSADENEINTDEGFSHEPDDDSFVRRNSDGKSRNYGDNTKLYVHSDDAKSANSRYSFIRFDRSEFPEFASAKKVYLKLFINESNVKNGGSGHVTLCGLEDGFECGGELYNCKTGWAESDITGNSAADLKLFSYNNYMAQCTVTGEEAPQTELCFDVTEYVKAQADGVYAFMVHAAADDASAPVFMSFYSSEASSAGVRPQLSAVGIDIMRTSVVQSNRSYAASGAVRDENISASAVLVVLCRDENGAVTDITVNKSSAARGGIALFACSGEAPPQTAHIKAMLVDLKTMKPFAGSREE